MIGYVPALFYSNMFSLVFLQMKARTKISDAKPEKDFKIGLTVVLAISLIYLFTYLPFFLGNLALGENSSEPD